MARSRSLDSVCFRLALAGIFLLMGGGQPRFAQAQGLDPSSRYEITSLTFEGNPSISTTELKAQCLTRQTPGFLDKFLHNSISEKLGRKNEYFIPSTLGADVDRLVKYYQNRGFTDVKIDTVLDVHNEDLAIDILVKVKEGYRSTVDTITYRGIVNTPGTVWEDIRSAPRIVPGDPFNRLILEEEVKRVIRVLANNGYPNARYVRDSSAATRYSSTKNYSWKPLFETGKRYLFGEIEVRQDIDTASHEGYRKDLSDDIVISQLDYQPGDFYSLEKRISSEKNLSRLGVFDLRGLDMIVPPNADSSITVKSNITIRPRDRHEVAPELLVSDENGALNLGAGGGYTNRNLLGGARTFSARLRGRTQTLSHPFDVSPGGSSVSNLDLTFELQQPYIFTNKVKGSWSFSFILDKQKQYRQNIVRNKIGVTDRFAEFTNGFLDWTLESVKLDTAGTGINASTDPEVRRQRQLLQPEQFNSILSFTIQRDMSNDLFSPSSGFINSLTLEESGILPLVIRGAVPNLPFTQFYRVNLSGRWYYEAAGNRFSILAWKLKAGFEDKYGESRSDTTRGIPQTHRFFAGGGGSVRGWNSRDLIASGDPQFGGNIQFEGSVELRTNILQALHDGWLDKIWLVQFVDFGNVWGQTRDLQFKTVAVAAGLGFRYDTFFGPFRIDWGFRVYNPSEIQGRQWITQRSLFGQTFKEAIFHFGIGHAF